MNKLIVSGPILTELNNGIIKAPKAMPMKDLTSDGAASFAMGRRDFFKGFTQIPPAINVQKKWIGGNRDASQVTANNRVHEIGIIASTNLPVSFKNVSDNNTQRQALHRARSGGCSVPAKKIHKYATAPTFY